MDPKVALDYVRKNVEEFKPEIREMLVGALRKRAPDVSYQRQLVVAKLRVKVLEGALSGLAAQAKAEGIGEGLSEEEACQLRIAVWALLRTLFAAVPRLALDTRPKMQDLYRAAVELKDLL